MVKNRLVGIALVAIFAIASVVAAEPGRVAVRAGAGGLDWQAAGDFGPMVLVVRGPEGTERFEFAAGVQPSLALFEKSGALRGDGVYRWELTAAPAGAPVTRDSADTAVGVRRGGFVESGSFAIRAGAFDLGEAEEAKLESAPQAATQDGDRLNDQVIADDLIVQGSACVGVDCVNNESFGFDTIRMKENNTRIKFEDTSTGTFPSTDWQLTANDSASGGQNKFSIEDITAARVPFTLEAASPSNSIYLDSSGKVGFRTTNPVLDLHISTSNTPGIRLEQNSSGGFTAQSWDLAGNESNFFVRDVTNGSKLPFRIRPGAPTSSLDIASTGNVGIGTASPSKKLHVVGGSVQVDGTDGTTQLVVSETSTTVANRVLMSWQNNGPVSTELVNSDSGGTTWRINNLVGGLAFNNLGNTGNEAFLSPTGTLTILQTLVENSDRNRKHFIVPVDPHDVLSRVAKLPVSTWSFIDSDPAERHLGPMAQDFAALFDIGINDHTISARDMAGVSLAAIQALSQELDTKKTEIETLKTENEDLSARLAALEAAVAKLVAPQN